ncbi:MAG TPA: hypothetical protein VLK84_32385 [Longimicrobium sp.]|nr:hypothetical protein [Longimicrobium sp.]
MPIGERMDFVVLDVLQGLGTFAGFYDKDDVLVATMILDLGTERFRKDDPFPAVDEVARVLRTMKPQPTVNAVLLSHSDTDHINLLGLLLSRFQPAGTPGVPVEDTLQVLFCKYAGARANFTKRGRNVLDTLKPYMPQDGTERIVGSASPETTFKGAYNKKTNPWIPVAQVAGASVYVLIANAAPSSAAIVTSSNKPKPAVPDTYGKNMVSIVSIVDYGASQLVVTGDATGITLAACNTVIQTAGVEGDLLIDNFMVTAPHHGSETTTYDMLGITTDFKTHDQLAEENLAQFVRHMSAVTLSASAGQVKKFRHPSARVIQAFWPKLGTALYQDPVLPEGLHFYTAYFTAGQYRVNVPNTPPTPGMSQVEWPVSANWWSVQTDKNIFSNLYFLSGSQGEANLPPAPGSRVGLVGLPTAVPPLGANWTFRVPRGLGVKRSVLRSDNRVTTLALRAQALGVRPETLGAAASPLSATPRAYPPAGVDRAAEPALSARAPAAGLAAGRAAAPPSRPAAAIRGLRVIP